MRLYTPVSIPFFLVLLASTAISVEQAEARGYGCGACRSDCNGKIIMKNPDTGRTLSADIKALVQETQAVGAGPISCIRPQRCQDQLVRCFVACGQPFRAARRSQHADGAACDWSRQVGGTLAQHRRKYPNIRHLVHREGGAGLHDFTTRWVASKVSDGDSVPARPTARGKKSGGSPSVAEASPRRGNTVSAASRQERHPAGSGGEYEQLSNGRYKCPARLSSVCGSTRSFPWCKSWIANGHTPGCYNLR